MKRNIKKKETARKNDIKRTGGGPANTNILLDETESSLLETIDPITIDGMDVSQTKVTFVSNPIKIKKLFLPFFTF